MYAELDAAISLFEFDPIAGRMTFETIDFDSLHLQRWATVNVGGWTALIGPDPHMRLAVGSGVAG